jgi:phosphoribosyl-ATP pyrophosphohydrolase
VKTFEELWQEIESKLANKDPDSGSVKLVSAGVHEIGKKIMEEAGEVWLAAEHQSNSDLALEISQLIYYLQLIAQARDIKIEDIYKEL